MSEAPKKRVGRPRKSPAEKAEQFSIRLPFYPKLALEIIARHRGVSLSQAAEYAINQVAESYEVEGTRILDLARSRIREGIERAGYCEATMPLDERIELQNAFMANENIKVFVFPDSLLKPEERYFKEVTESMPDHYGASMDYDVLMSICVDAYFAGIPQDDVVAKVIHSWESDESLSHNGKDLYPERFRHLKASAPKGRKKPTSK